MNVYDVTISYTFDYENRLVDAMKHGRQEGPIHRTLTALNREETISVLAPSLGHAILAAQKEVRRLEESARDMTIEQVARIRRNLVAYQPRPSEALPLIQEFMRKSKKDGETMHEYTLRGFASDTQRATLDLLHSSKPHAKEESQTKG